LFVTNNLLFANKTSNLFNTLKSKPFKYLENNAPSGIEKRAKREIKLFIYRMSSENSRKNS